MLAMTDKPLAIGDLVDSRCSKCKEVTNHVIASMVDGEIAKVTCNICESTHKYRPPAPPKEPKAPKEPKTPRVRKSTTAKTAAAAKKEAVPSPELEEWRSLCANPENAELLPYGMGEKFKEHDLISHKTFGIGIVKQTIGVNKIRVLFESGLKLLRCDNSQ
jgi:hypothetical protein